MGQHASSLKQVVQEEFARLKTDEPKAFKDDGIVLEKFRDINQPESPYYLSLDHLGVLYLADSDKDGRFSLKEVEELIDHAEVFSHKCTVLDFRKKFQGFCSLRMWKEIESPNGKDEFVAWVLKLIKPGCIKAPIPAADGSQLWHISAASGLHDLLCVRDTQKLSVQEFKDMLRTDISARQAPANLSDAEQDNWIPQHVISEVVLDVLDGMASLVHEVFGPGEVELTLNGL